MNPLINLMHLKFFCDAVIYNSASEAAKVNYVTQSAISQGIIKLEKVLGTQLIIHSRQKFQLTDDGKILFEQSRHIFKSVQEIYDKLNQSKQVVEGKLNFVSTNSLGMSFLASAYQKLRTNLPHVEMNFRLGGLNFIRNSLRQGDAEFAIVVYDQSFAQFSKHSLRKGRFHLYQNMHAPHYFIENGVLIDAVEGMYVQELSEHFVHRNGLELKIKAELAAWEVVARFTEKNIGIGFFPDYIMANDHYPTIKIHPFEIPSFEYEICAIYNKGEKLSRAACAFLEQFSVSE